MLFRALPAPSLYRPFASPCPDASHPVLHARKSVRPAARKQSKGNKKSTSGSGTGNPPLSYDEFVAELQPLFMSSAPSTSDTPNMPEDEGPETIYPVFLPKGNETSSGAPWRWADDNGPAPPKEPEPDTLVWNPYTGFAPRAADQGAQVQSRAEASSVSSGASGSASRSGSKGFAGAGRGRQPQPEQQQQSSTDTSAAQRRDGGATASTSGSGRQQPLVNLSANVAPDALPFVTRNQVLSNAVGTGFWMTLLALVMRTYAQTGAVAALGTDPDLVSALLVWPSGLNGATDYAVLAGTVAAVTGARLQLLRVWDDFRSATYRSNKQVLGPLGWLDVALVAAVSGIPEELLFRGAIIPASFPDWRGVVLSGMIFGALHNSGGRNPAFAVWAGAVGCVYGGAFVLTQNIWVPAAAHVLSNFASAAVWKTEDAESKA